jgi:hypothetical protein
VKVISLRAQDVGHDSEARVIQDDMRGAFDSHLAKSASHLQALCAEKFVRKGQSNLGFEASNLGDCVGHGSCS